MSHIDDLPEVALITTLYFKDNVRYADSALESIVKQSYPSAKINIYLCIDGDISDEHYELLSKYKKRLNFKVILKNEINIGLALSLNRLIDQLNDEKYIFRMDLDDLCLPSRFLKQVLFMEENHNIGLVGSNTFEINSRSEEVGVRDYPKSHESIERKISRSMPILHPTFCLRKTVFDNGLRYKNVYLTEDLQFLIDFLKAGFYAENLQERLLCWRLSDDFWVRRNSKRSVVEFKTYLLAVMSLKRPKYEVLYPFARLFFRMLPSFLVKLVYHSKLRNNFLK